MPDDAEWPHRSAASSAAAVMAAAIDAMRSRWNEGWASRRYRSQSSPPLVRSPFPNKRLIMR